MTENNLLLTKDNDENVGHGEGDEIIVHSAVQALALDDHHDHGEIAEESTEEDHDVEDRHEPEEVLKMEQSNQNISQDIKLNNK